MELNPYNFIIDRKLNKRRLHQSNKLDPVRHQSPYKLPFLCANNPKLRTRKRFLKKTAKIIIKDVWLSTCQNERVLQSTVYADHLYNIYRVSQKSVYIRWP